MRGWKSVGVVGLGYVGLPLAVEFCEAGANVVGIEKDQDRLFALRAYRPYVPLVRPDILRSHLDGCRLWVGTETAALRDCDAIIVCVQTPLRKSREPDLSHVAGACAEVSKILRRGQLVVVESTMYPGATEEVVRPALERSGLRAGKDFLLACSPERIDPGNPYWGIRNTPKVVAGIDAKSAAAARNLYSLVVNSPVVVSGTATAEFVKLLENSFRSVNIALANEAAMMCRRLGIDVWEAIRAAATKPFGFMPFFPGPGIGGHCIPKDPQLLSWKMRTLGFESRLLGLASAINESMPAYTVSRIAESLNRDGKPLRRSKILVVGVAYKPGVSDYRESPSLDVMRLLAERGAKVSYHDPLVPCAEDSGRLWRSVALTPSRLWGADLVAVLTAQKKVDYSRVRECARRIFDARDATGLFSGAEKL